MRWVVIPALFMVCFGGVVFADDTQILARSISPEVVQATQKHDAAVKEAKEAYHKAIISADQQYVAELDAAMKQAMSDQNIDLCEFLTIRKRRPSRF